MIKLSAHLLFVNSIPIEMDTWNRGNRLETFTYRGDYQNGKHRP